MEAWDSPWPPPEIPPEPHRTARDSDDICRQKDGIRLSRRPVLSVARRRGRQVPSGQPGGPHSKAHTDTEICPIPVPTAAPASPLHPSNAPQKTTTAPPHTPPPLP